MGFRNLIPTRKVVLGSGDDSHEIVVRGLSLADITAVMKEDGGAEFIGGLFAAGINNGFSGTDFEELIFNLLDSIPHILAKICARAADIPDEWPDLVDVPIGITFDMLETIADLTFTSETVTKKLMAAALRYAPKIKTPDLKT